MIEPIEICSIAPTEDEYKIDQRRIEKLANKLRKKYDIELQLDEADYWEDRWRVPVIFSNDCLRLDGNIFKKVHKEGAELVVEEKFDTNNNRYFIEIGRTRLKGWYAWARYEQYILLCTLCLLFVSGYHILGHVEQYFTTTS